MNNSKNTYLYLTIAVSIVVIASLSIFATVFSTKGTSNPETSIENLEGGLLPLGDDKYSSEPKIGYVYSCQTSFNGGGAFTTGEWIDVNEGYWDPSGKVTVDGSNDWPNASVSIDTRGTERRIVANGLPIDHGTGDFPVDPSDDAYDYDRNPNTVSEQRVVLSMPLNPTIADEASCVSMGKVAYTLNGVAVFNAFDAEGRDAPAYEIQDECDGHPERSGEYHYHSHSKCFNDNDDANGHSDLVAYALDGFGLYGYKGEDGKDVSNSDLDECHGHTHEIDWDDDTKGMYHYHMTHEFPYTIGCYRGN